MTQTARHTYIALFFLALFGISLGSSLTAAHAGPGFIRGINGVTGLVLR